MRVHKQMSDKIWNVLRLSLNFSLSERFKFMLYTRDYRILGMKPVKNMCWILSDN